MKNWYQISENVEYSTDFNFFIQNQLFFDIQGSRVIFYSRLEYKTFLNESDTFGLRYYKRTANYQVQKKDEDYVLEMAKKIHTQILNGEHGKGKFVD